MNVKTLRSLFLMLVCVCMLAVMATPALAWWVNQNNDPANAGGPWAAATDCGWYRYVISHFSSCAARGAWVAYQPGFVWYGRGFIHMDYVMTPKGYTNDLLQYYNSGYGNPYNAWVNTCPYGCQWLAIVDGYTNEIYNWNGLYMNADNSTACGSPGICGSAVTASRSINTYADRFAYLNDWTILGPYSQATLAETTGTGFLSGEANLYMFPYVDTGGGDTICAGLFNGKHPERYNPGDMNNAHIIDYAARWGALSNVSAYALAWVYSPGGAGPDFMIGSDDGERCWVNGALITDTGTIGRGLTRDSDATGGIGLPAGWSRVMLKVQSGGGGWGGTVSLRAGGDNRQCEGSVNFQASAGGGVDRYGGYSVGYEQDSWYPTLTLSNADGVSSPGLGAVIYTNATTVTASGTAAASFIPFWKTMQTQWGYGISGSTNYLPTTDYDTSWSHSEAGVTGHRRFHFFGVSASGRTSGQASGQGSGWTYDNSGHANYFDVYVDNAVPVAPSLSSVTVVSPNRVDVAWGIPLDVGCGGVSNGSTEVATATNGGTNYYLRGDVGVNVRRNTTSIYGFGTGTSASDTGLTSNTQYTYDVAARDNTGESRGAWHNTTSYVGTTSVYTLAAAPTAGTNISAPTSGSYRSVEWPGVTNPEGFGTDGKVSKFMYKWSTSASDSIAENEGSDWSSGTLTNLPGTGGTYYLYVRSYNAAGVGNGSLKLGSYEIVYDSAAPTIDSVTSPAASNASPIVVSYSVTDTESGVKQVTLWAKKGSSGTWAATAQTSTSASGTLNYTGMSGDDTYYFGIVAEDNANNKTADPSGVGSTHTLYDTTDPTADVTLTPESQGTENYLKGKVTVEVTAADTDGSGIDKVEMKLDDGEYSQMTESEGTYTDDSTTITSAWTNGAHSITVKVTDNAGNSVEVVKDFNVNKNEVSGLIALQGFTFGSVSRSVTFVVNGTTTRTVALTFVGGQASYSLTDVPEVTSISAKTNWSLRKKLTVVPDNGQSIRDFTGSYPVLGGDLNGDNVANALDYAVLRAAWGSGSAGDINGSGTTDNTDYLIMKDNWYKKGDTP